MRTNRILVHLADCDCRRERRRDQLCESIANELQLRTGDAVTFSALHGELCWWPAAMPEPILETDVDHAAEVARSQILDFIDALTFAAVRLEGGAV
jgi:hypothetical protein